MGDVHLYKPHGVSAVSRSAFVACQKGAPNVPRHVALVQQFHHLLSLLVSRRTLQPQRQSLNPAAKGSDKWREAHTP